MNGTRGPGPEDRPVSRGGEYQARGDYHREPDRGWRYYPVYLAKKRFIGDYMKGISRDTKILDAGCGEGVLVEAYRSQGYPITGLDLHYSSDCICQGSITRIPFGAEEFDLVLCLDVIEHLAFEDQVTALAELGRVLRPGGTLVLALPNLAHLLSRISFLFAGALIRTSSIDRHPGDRPIREYIDMVQASGFRIVRRKGIFPTFPLLSLLTHYRPQKVGRLHSIYNVLLAYPNWCFLNMVICRKSEPPVP